MAKVRTISRTFLKGHPREGQPTKFVEKYLNSLGVDYNASEYRKKLLDLNHLSITLNKLSIGRINKFCNSLSDCKEAKHHTIRGGHPDEFKEHFRQGDKVSIRCWSGKPYASPQIILWEDVELKEICNVLITDNAVELLDTGISFHKKENYLLTDMTIWERLAVNDGLSPEDITAWFNKLPFKGQILVWGNVKY